MCNNFFRFVPAPIFGKENLPATKYLDCDIMLFWWLEKNKDLTTKQMVDELYSLICDRINDPITYKELKSKKLGLDTKGHHSSTSLTDAGHRKEPKATSASFHTLKVTQKYCII